MPFARFAECLRLRRLLVRLLRDPGIQRLLDVRVNAKADIGTSHWANCWCVASDRVARGLLPPKPPDTSPALHEPLPQMLERARQPPHDGKAERFPQAHGAVVGGDDEVELHGAALRLGRRRAQPLTAPPRGIQHGSFLFGQDGPTHRIGVELRAS